MATQAVVLAASVAASTADAHVTFHMLHPPMDPRVVGRIRAGLNGPRFTVVDHTVDPTALELPAFERAHLATWLRLLLPAIVPAARVIYLDADTLVRRSLTVLYRLDLAGAAVAASVDLGFLRLMREAEIAGHDGRLHAGSVAYCRDVVGLDITRQPYLNAGVMVLDLEQWRARGLALRCFAFAQTAPLIWRDQDAINHVLQGDFVRLDQRWNAMPGMQWQFSDGPIGHSWPWRERGSLVPDAESMATLAAWACDPWIIHYVASSKPWLYPNVRTGREALYWRMLRRAPIGARGQMRALAAQARIARRGAAQDAMDGWDWTRARALAWVRAHPVLGAIRPRARLLALARRVGLGRKPTR